METFFTWIPSPTEIFDPRTHKRKDLDIFNLTVEQREGEIAFAVLTAKTPSSPLRQHALIAYGDHLLFRGKLEGLPLYKDKNLIELHFTAESEDADEHLHALGHTLKHPPYWDELFIDPFHHDKPSELLEARSSLFSWDRTTGQVKLSDIFKGQQHLLLTDAQIFKDSLKIRFTTPPLESIQVQVVCEWVQLLEGEADLAPLIARQFSKGMINTLTPKTFKRQWPKPYTPLNRSGYSILESDLKEVIPPYTGSLDVYPTISPTFCVLDNNRPTQKRIRRCWLQAKLVVGWFYKQKRREIATFTLKHKTSFGTIGKKRTLALHLQSAGDTPRASFFHTDRGRQALIHAIEIARCHLAGSARCLEIELTIPFEQGLTLTTDHTIALKVPQLPHLQGKLVAYRLTRENNTAWLKIAVAMGAHREPTKPSSQASYVQDDYASLGPQGIHSTPSGIRFNDYSQQNPKEGVLVPLTAANLIETLTIHAEGAEQIAWIVSNQYPTRDRPLEALEPTQIRLELRDLQTKDVLEHVIPIEILDPWSAPPYITGD